MGWVVAIAISMFIATFYFHFVALMGLHRFNIHHRRDDRSRFGLTIVAILLIHMAEIFAYALAHLGVHRMGLGDFGGEAMNGFQDYMYFSIVSYTTLGIGDIFPKGGIRLLAGVEALNGLLLVAWSASFTYFDMERMRQAESE